MLILKIAIVIYITIGVLITIITFIGISEEIKKNKDSRSFESEIMRDMANDQLYKCFILIFVSIFWLPVLIFYKGDD